jgi:hypothetical protein
MVEPFETDNGVVRGDFAEAIFRKRLIRMLEETVDEEAIYREESD